MAKRIQALCRPLPEVLEVISASDNLPCYRLKVTYPPEALTPEGWLDWRWQPPDWEPAPYDYHDPYGDVSFHWPRANRRFFSKKCANDRADLLRKFGATVEVEESAPIEWPSDG